MRLKSRNGKGSWPSVHVCSCKNSKSLGLSQLLEGCIYLMWATRLFYNLASSHSHRKRKELFGLKFPRRYFLPKHGLYYYIAFRTLNLYDCFYDVFRPAKHIKIYSLSISSRNRLLETYQNQVCLTSGDISLSSLTTFQKLLSIPEPDGYPEVDEPYVIQNVCILQLTGPRGHTPSRGWMIVC